MLKRGEGESPPSTSPDDANQTFKFTLGEGQALQVRSPPASTCLFPSGCLMRVWTVFRPFPSDQPSTGFPPSPGYGQSQEWRTAGGAVSSWERWSCENTSANTMERKHRSWLLITGDRREKGNFRAKNYNCSAPSHSRVYSQEKIKTLLLINVLL